MTKAFEENCPNCDRTSNGYAGLWRCPECRHAWQQAEPPHDHPTKCDCEICGPKWRAQPPREDTVLGGPAIFSEPAYLCDVPHGSKLIAIAERIVLIAPSLPPQYVTPTGLVPMMNAKDKV